MGKESMNWLTLAKVWSEVGEVLESDVYGKNIPSPYLWVCHH